MHSVLSGCGCGLSGIDDEDEETPAQVIEKYPELNMFGWGTKEIGMFLKIKLLHGFYNHNLRKSMILETSIEALVDFANGVVEQQKVRIIFPVKKR